MTANVTITDLTAVSLFAGVGGFDRALTRAGVRVVAAVEIDPAARGVIADQFPDIALFEDVTKVTADELRAVGFVPERGIITAGWPCQGNSVAGRRGGMADPRSGLWTHVVRLLADTGAAWFFGENVPGLLSVNDGDDFGVVLNDLAELGMGFAWRVLDAQFFGVPQRRSRVFIVGHLGDADGPVQVLFEPESSGRDSAPRRAPGQRVAATLTAGVAGTGVSAPGRRQEDDVNPVPVGALTARYGKGTDSDATDAMIVSTVQGGGVGDIGSTPSQRPAVTSSRSVVMALTSNGVGTCGADDNQAQAGHLLPFDLAQITSSANRSNPNPGEPSSPVLNGGNLHVAITGAVTHALTSEGADASEDGTGRGTPIIGFSHTAGIDLQASEAVYPTVKAGHDSMPATATATAVRRLTPLECERLQGFPDNWTATSWGKPQSDSARYRQMGNSVAVPCVEWVARRIVAVDGGAA
jgi:DNA (cytosine-5)-methyltransferase 1